MLLTLWLVLAFAFLAALSVSVRISQREPAATGRLRPVDRYLAP
ncbi:hypothetical protein [Paraburkholderia fungorum]|nr:hypothetical protein [Paraburkholderia fungorum]